MQRSLNFFCPVSGLSVKEKYHRKIRKCSMVLFQFIFGCEVDFISFLGKILVLTIPSRDISFPKLAFP
jgi:hypothetical protein